MITAVQSQNGTTTVQLQGSRLDASVAETVKSEIKQIIDKGERHLIVDFATVQFMDSSGLGSLVGALKMMGPGGQMEIINAAPAVLKVLKLTRMNKVFTIREG
ncbi:MAG: STAS domain-containing protein [Pseudomonadota bacterium]